MFEDHRFREVLSRSSLLIAYLILTVGAVVAFSYMQSITERVELEGMVRAHENCVAANEAKLTIAAVLDRIAAERRGDETDDEIERRRELREELNTFLDVRECPPAPGLGAG